MSNQPIYPNNGPMFEKTGMRESPPWPSLGRVNGPMREQTEIAQLKLAYDELKSRLEYAYTALDKSRIDRRRGQLELRAALKALDIRRKLVPYPIFTLGRLVIGWLRPTPTSAPSTDDSPCGGSTPPVGI